MSAPTPIGPFELTVDAVYALAPEAERVTDPNQSKLPTPITEATVAGWIGDVSAAVSAGIGRWGDITAGPTLDTIKAAGRAVVANGAASYLEAARYPTQAGLNDSSYAAVLWARYTAGTAALAAQVTAIIEEGEDVVVDGTSIQAGPFGAFPPPYFGDRTQW